MAASAILVTFNENYWTQILPKLVIVQKFHKNFVMYFHIFIPKMSQTTETVYTFTVCMLIQIPFHML